MLRQDLWVPWCGGLTGFTGRQELDYAGAPHAIAQQYLFTFSSADAAHTAYQAIVYSRPDCAARSKAGQAQRGVPADTVVTQTAAATTMSAWSWHWTGYGTPVSSDGPQLDHEYLVQRGPVLSILDFNEPLQAYAAAPATGTAADPTTLNAIADHICGGYSQACK
jgi:hypothetical protein